MTMQDLRTCRAMVLRLVDRRERIARLRSAMETVTQQISVMPSHAGERDRIAAQVAKLDALERAYADELIAAETALRAIDRDICALPPAQERVIRLRYVDGLSWREVARRCGYSVDHCFAIHRAVLQNIQKNGSAI